MTRNVKDADGKALSLYGRNNDDDDEEEDSRMAIGEGEGDAGVKALITEEDEVSE